MKIKSIVRFQLRGYLKIFRTVYFIIYLIVLASFVGSLLDPSSRGNARNSGMEFATLITSFVVGLFSFRESFLFYTGSGVSRKAMFQGILASFGIMSAATALLDCINIVLFSCIMKYQSLYYALTQIARSDFGSVPATDHPLAVPFLLKNFLWCVLAYFCAAAIGFFITALYYRMNRPLKIAVSAGVPIAVFYLLPLLDTSFWGGTLGAALFRFWEWGLALAVSPLWDLAASLCFSAVFAGLAFLLIRRADVKKQ